MAQSTALIDTLKRTLRAHRITYAEVARALGLSEASIKRLFASGNLSLQRLEAICGLMGLEVTDLVRLMDEQRERIAHLTREQEEELVADTRLLLVAVCVNGHWRFEDIVRHYAISATECIRLLARLDRLKLIELQPGNRVRLLISNNFGWQKNGAIEKFFRSQVQSEFFDDDFRDEGAIRIVKNGMLSKKGQMQLAERLRAIGDQFDDATRDERKLSINQRQGTTMVLAIRHWFFPAFRKLERR